MRLNQSGFSIFSLLFKLVVLLLVYYLITKVYFNLIFSGTTRQYLKTQGVNTTDIQGMLESVKYKVADINQALARRAVETEKMFEEGNRGAEAE